MDFLVHMEISGDLGTEAQESALRNQEAECARQLGARGVLRRLWRIPGRRANWGIWTAATSDELHKALASLPLFPYLTITIHPLGSHPNDPKRELDL